MGRDHRDSGMTLAAVREKLDDPQKPRADAPGLASFAVVQRLRTAPAR
jgi:hypothetical protein